MTNREITESVNLLKNLFGNELESDLRKFVRSVFNDESLNVGIRYGNDLIVREIKFTSYMVLDEDEGIVMDTKYKPEEFSHNDFNYYFGAEEIIVNNKRGIFFAVIGNEWFKNNLGDEFVEAIIFGDHDIPFIDCYYDNDKYKVVLVWDAGYWVYGDMEPDSKVWESIFQKIELTWSTASQRFAIWTRFFGYEEDEYYDALIEELKKDVIQLEGNIAFTPTEVLRKTCLVIEDKEEPNEWDEELYDMAYHELHERGKELR